jgi:Spy/CpxP family protein refolding chaperone
MGRYGGNGMQQKLLTVLSIIAIMALSPFASPGDSSGVEMKRGAKIARELGLSDPQKLQLKGLRHDMHEFRKGQMDKMKELLDKSRLELLKPSPNRDVLFGYAKEMGEVRRVMAEKEADHLLKVKAVLTPDQFTKLLSKDFMEGKDRGPGAWHDSLHGNRPHHDGGPHEHGGPQ